MKSICIIPARGGSKRIPRKNIRPFLGVPIIQRVIETALESHCFSEVMVSTEDHEIRDLALAAGARVPFLREPELADDHTPTLAVLQQVIRSYRRAGQSFETGCCLYPTAVLTRPAHLQDAQRQLFQSPDLAYLVPVLRYSHPAQRALSLNPRAMLEPLFPEWLASRSQDLAPSFHDAGQWYWFHTRAVETAIPILGPHSAGFEVSELEAQDLDNEIDWKLAEMKFKIHEDRPPTQRRYV